MDKVKEEKGEISNLMDQRAQRPQVLKLGTEFCELTVTPTRSFKIFIFTRSVQTKRG